MFTFPSRLSLFSGAVALSLLASTATATPVSLVYNGSSVTDPEKRETVNITTVPTGSADEGTVYATGFNMTDTSPRFLHYLA